MTEAHGQSIAISVRKGEEIAKKTFGSDLLVSDLGRAMMGGVNENIRVTATGLTLVGDYMPSENEVTEAVAGLCGISAETGKFKTAVGWCIGDAALWADRFDGGMDRVVNQAITEKGITKHTVMQAVRVCREFPHDQRIPGLSITHHQEILNYREGIQDKAALDDLIGELRETAESGDPMSCADLRERLADLSTGNRKKKDKQGDVYLYVDSDSRVWYSDALDQDICGRGSHMVINATKLAMVDPGGNPSVKIPKLPDAQQ